MLGKFSHKTYTYKNPCFYFCALKHTCAHMHTGMEICWKGMLDPICKGYILQAVSQSRALSEVKSLKLLGVDIWHMPENCVRLKGCGRDHIS